MTTKTTAEQVAAMFDNDGLCFEVNGVTLEQACRDAGAVHPDATFNRENCNTRFVFRDGSAIVIGNGAGWDVRHSRCTCGWCWGGSGDLPTCLERAMDEARHAPSGTLIDSDTREDLGPATEEQREASDAAGPEGHILIDDESGDVVSERGPGVRRVFVQP